MARKTRTLQIDMTNDTKKEVVIKELTVGQIIDFLDKGQESESEDVSIEPKTFMDIFDHEFLPLCTNLKKEDFLKMPPSDIKEIWDAFKEVNSVFFVIAHKVGLTEALENMKEEIVQLMQEEFLKRVADLSSQGIQKSLTTDTPT